MKQVVITHMPAIDCDMKVVDIGETVFVVEFQTRGAKEEAKMKCGEEKLVIAGLDLVSFQSLKFIGLHSDHH